LALRESDCHNSSQLTALRKNHPNEREFARSFPAKCRLNQTKLNG
jgi:hypothetical protein